MAALAPELGPLAFLLGIWEGGGEGDYPTIEPFAFSERIEIDHVGDTFLRIAQESFSVADGAPLHFERGFLRPGAADGELELTMAHPLGLTEVAHGALEGTSFTLRTRPGDVGRTRTGMDTTGLVRRYHVDGDVFRYELDMETERTSMTFHLRSELRRVG